VREGLMTETQIKNAAKKIGTWLPNAFGWAAPGGEP
jgi:hypothetical protein